MLVRDVGYAKDASQIQYNIVRVDGQPSVYLPVFKQGGDANTIAIVDGVKKAIKDLLDVPKSLVTKVVFDQSVFVKTAIENLLHEGAIGLVLTGLMILVFLGNVRATLAVFLSIPLSALAAFIALAFGGSSINSMILGGLALAFSRLIDNSVVVLENIFRHMELGESPRGRRGTGRRRRWRCPCWPRRSPRRSSFSRSRFSTASASFSSPPWPWPWCSRSSPPTSWR